MCIKLSTVKIPQIKGFFEDKVKKQPEKVDSFAGNPLVIHKLWIRVLEVSISRELVENVEELCV